MTAEKPSVDRQRDGTFNLYVPRRDGEPEDTRPYMGQFNSLMEADAYAKEKFGVSIDLEDLRGYTALGYVKKPRREW